MNGEGTMPPAAGNQKNPKDNIFLTLSYFFQPKPPCSTLGSILRVEVGEEERVEIGVFVETEVREVRKSGTSGCADIEDTPGREYQSQRGREF